MQFDLAGLRLAGIKFPFGKLALPLWKNSLAKVCLEELASWIALK
jgi:hypothetical protein